MRTISIVPLNKCSKKNEEGHWALVDWPLTLIGEKDPYNSLGSIGNYYLDTNNWRISKKLASTTLQSLEFLGSNNHQQAQIPEWNEEIAPSLTDKKEREAIARYFDTPYYEYQFTDLKRIPSIEFKVNFNDATKRNVTVEYTIQDYDSVIIDGSLTLYYGTYSGFLSQNLFSNVNTKKVTVDIPEEGKLGLSFTGEIVVEGLRQDAEYQFAFGYKVITYKTNGDPQETQNSSYSTAIRTAGNGKPSANFRKIRQEINGISKELVTLPIVGIANDPIKKIELGQNVTSILTESGRLFTWGSTSSNSNRLGNTIRNKLPIKDFTYARHHILVLREDNSIEIYGPSTNAIALNLTQKYPYLKLSYTERLKLITEDVKRLEKELVEWETKVPLLIRDIDERVRTAQADLVTKTALYEAELIKYRSVPAEFATLSRNYANALLQYNNSVLQLENFIIVKDDAFNTLNSAMRTFVNNIDTGEDPLTGAIIYEEYLKEFGEEGWADSYISRYADAVDRVLAQEAVVATSEVDYNELKELYEAFETEEARSAYEDTLANFSTIRDNMIDAQDHLAELLNERELLNTKVQDLHNQIQNAGKQMVYIEKIAGTTDNGIVLTSNNELLVWGSSSSPVNNIPYEAKIGKIIDLQAGLFHVIVVKEDGQFVIWGQNELNQLKVPKKLTTVDKVYIGRFHTYAVDKDGKIFAWGNNGYIFGTDSQGRSLFHRILQGGKVSMTVGAIAVLISLVIGVSAGLIAGFYGGWIDNIIMRFSEVVNSFPFLPLAITLSSVIGYRMQSDQKMYLIMVILGVLSWPGLCRLVRGQILSEREKDFVTAARALGIKEKNIILRHILPNVINVIIVNTTLAYAGSLLTEAGLSFLGFGVVPPKPSWGNLLTGAQNLSVIKEYWWLWILPACFIVITALSINLIGDGLREAMDPKANER